MLETLTQGFTTAREKLRGIRKLSEENVEQALQDVRTSLLEADVDYGITKDFLARIKERSLGEKVETRVRDATGRMRRATPGQHFVAICEQELVNLMGPVDSRLTLDPQGTVSVLLVGLQGVGKTTVAAKIARHLAREQGKRPLLVAADARRPAAVLQLQQLGASIDVTVHAGAPGDGAVEICGAAVARARAEGFDAIVYDTAGRLAIDDDLMAELEAVGADTGAANRLLVCDALMGRDAIQVARAFHARLPLDGIVLTKLDGDSRGGAALAVKAATGVPIKFLGTGEALDRLEPFRPEGLASRILGMGDVVGLVRDFESVVDEKQAEADAERILGGRFGMDDLLTQLRTLQKMGSLRDVVAKLPGLGSLASQVDEGELVKVEAMIQSMTRAERSDPTLIDKSRAARIGRGSGRRSKEIFDLLQRFSQMKEMMSSFGGGGGPAGRIPGFGRLAGAGGAGMDPMALLGGADGTGAGATRSGVSPRKRQQQKRKRKQAQKARRKHRRR